MVANCLLTSCSISAVDLHAFPFVNFALQPIQTQAEAGCLPNDVTKALKAVLDNTSEQVSAVQTCLSKTISLDGASKLERALKALTSLAKEDQVQQALEKMHKNNDILVLHQTTRHVDTGDRILERAVEVEYGITCIRGVVWCMPGSGTSDRAGCFHWTHRRVAATARLAVTQASPQSATHC